MTNKVEIEIYLDDGRAAYYEVESPKKAREHMGLIVKTVWRACIKDRVLNGVRILNILLNIEERNGKII